MMKKINVLILNGPNLNLLGKREIKIYGDNTLSDLSKTLYKEAKLLNISLDIFQSNSEHRLIEKIHLGLNKVNFIIFNPAAFTHTSIALRDAILSVNIPFIEVHISNIYSRESFRSHSWFSDISSGTICGFGFDGYIWALRSIPKKLQVK
ncbi:type II 3-dehydroquinate dehydratase [Buchnera aphidicola]